jgi:hypothetical protein
MRNAAAVVSQYIAAPEPTMRASPTTRASLE